MQQLLGLSNKMYLLLRNTNYWIKQKGNKSSSKEKHFEFSKEIFKIWDADGGGFLDVDEISLPLIALGLSTDTGFVEKLIRSLKMNKKKPTTNKGDTASITGGTTSKVVEVDDLSFTLKDFVSIFKADRIGERISKRVKEVC